MRIEQNRIFVFIIFNVNKTPAKELNLHLRGGASQSKRVWSKPSGLCPSLEDLRFTPGPLWPGGTGLSSV